MMHACESFVHDWPNLWRVACAQLQVYIQCTQNNVAIARMKIYIHPWYIWYICYGIYRHILWYQWYIWFVRFLECYGFHTLWCIWYIYGNFDHIWQIMFCLQLLNAHCSRYLSSMHDEKSMSLRSCVIVFMTRWICDTPWRFRRVLLIGRKNQSSDTSLPVGHRMAGHRMVSDSHASIIHTGRHRDNKDNIPTQDVSATRHRVQDLPHCWPSQPWSLWQTLSPQLTHWESVYTCTVRTMDVVHDIVIASTHTHEAVSARTHPCKQTLWQLCDHS